MTPKNTPRLRRGPRLQPPSKQEQPRCFTTAQWRLWLDAARSPNLSAVHHCTDCTPEHQADMTARQLCDNPHGQATRDADGFIQITPPHPQPPAKETP